MENKSNDTPHIFCVTLSQSRFPCILSFIFSLKRMKKGGGKIGGIFLTNEIDGTKVFGRSNSAPEASNQFDTLKIYFASVI